MAKRLQRPLKDLLRDARSTLSMTQADFGPALGWSHRTAVRWERGLSAPYPPTLVKLASLLAPVHLDLAAEAAIAAGETLESLGLAPPPPAKETSRAVAPGDLADLVVCAVADATDLLPRALRPLLHAAFARARSLGLTVEEVEESLRSRVDPKTDERETLRLRVRVEPQEAREPAPEPASEPGVERRSRSKRR